MIIAYILGWLLVAFGALGVISAIASRFSKDAESAMGFVFGLGFGVPPLIVGVIMLIALRYCE